MWVLRKLYRVGRACCSHLGGLPYAARFLAFGAGLLLYGCVGSSTVKMMDPHGNIRECPRGKSTWQNEGLKEQRACMKAYRDAGYVRVDETSFPVTQIPMSKNKNSPSAELPVANKAGANPGYEATLVDQLRKFRDAHNQGLIPDAEYKLRRDEIIDQL